MAENPSDAGAVYETVAVLLTPETLAVPMVGAPGTVNGVTGSDAALGALVTPFDAVTVNVYDVPLVKPLTMISPLPAWFKVPVIPPGLEVTV